MGRPFIVEYDESCIQCHACGTQVAFMEDYIETEDEPPYVPQGIFTKMFNVEIPEDEPYHQVVDGITLADTYCVYCRDRLGWKLVAAPQGSNYEQGPFLTMLDKVSYSNGQPMALNDQAEDINEQVPNEQDLGTNEENAAQEGGDNEENPDQDGDANEQVPDEQYVGANEDNADQDGGANEQVPDEQDVGANEDNADQGGGVNEQDGGANGHY